MDFEIDLCAGSLWWSVFRISTHGKGREEDWAEGEAELGATRAGLLPKGSHAQLTVSRLDTKWVSLRPSVYGWKLAPVRVCSWLRD